jgi:hypothetical protein
VSHSYTTEAELAGVIRVHDTPPRWDGKSPESQLEPYLKLLQAWLATTTTMKSQRGMVILNHASGDLRIVINNFDLATLTSETSGEAVVKHLSEQFSEYLTRQLPRAMERAI